MENIHIYSIDGNIGSGKSTIIKLLKEKFKTINKTEIIYLPEPVKTWSSIKDKEGENIIEKFYKDNKKYAFAFQMMAYITRINQIKKVIKNLKSNKNYIIVTERSVHTDKNVFAKMLYNNKDINECEYQIYNKWFDEFISDIPIHKYIYIDTDPKKCLERIEKRSRKGENKIPIEYLEMCKKHHDIWLNQLDDVFWINGDVELGTTEHIEVFNDITRYIFENTHTRNIIDGTEITMEMLMNHPFF